MVQKYGVLIKNNQCLEKVQLRFCQLSLKLNTSTPRYMIYGELGVVSY
jgi:hypothetical protein